MATVQEFFDAFLAKGMATRIYYHGGIIDGLTDGTQERLVNAFSIVAQEVVGIIPHCVFELLSGWPRASFFKLSTNKFRRKGILIKEGLYCVVEVLFGRVDILLEQFPCINFDISTWGEIE